MSGAMRVAVVGAGAMGTLYGAMLADAGHEVTMIDRSEAVVAAIRARGMRITRQDGRQDSYRPAAATAPEAGSRFDLILFLVKGFATAEAAATMAAWLGPDGAVATFQNGLGNEEALAAVFPGRPLLLGISIHSCSTLGPGETLHSGVRCSLIGPARPADAAWTGRLAAALARSGFAVEALDEAGIRRQIFAKWVLNCGSLPTAALTCLPTAALAASPEARSVAAALTREACELAAREGHVFDPEERIAFNEELFRTAGGKASMLQDIEAGRRTEIDSITGAAVRLADRHGLAAPLSRAVLSLLRARETAALRPAAAAG
jgi:2-dehydropantoate 2-reductase